MAQSDTLNIGSSGLIPYGDADHPAMKYCSEFISHAGAGGHQWVKDNTSIGDQAWCAATCCAVAKACGFNGVNMPGDDYGAGTFGGQIAGKPGLPYYGGSRIMGPKYDNPAVPVPGDFILFQFGAKEDWVCDHIGLVTQVSDTTVTTYEGNNSWCEDQTNKDIRYGKHTYNINSTSIAWYARPDWTKVGGQMPVPGQSYPNVDLTDRQMSTGTLADGTQESEHYQGPLYTTENTREDALIREVGYMTKAAQPSINKTGVRLSIINYTGLLGRLYDQQTGYLKDVNVKSEDTLAEVDPIHREIIEYFENHGFATAVGSGIAACSIDVDSDGVRIGFMGWPKTRGAAMKTRCGGDDSFKTNLTGQLDYMWWELNTSTYQTLRDRLLKLPNVLKSTSETVDLIFGSYITIGNQQSYIDDCKESAVSIWTSIVTTSTQGVDPEVSAAQGRIAFRSGTQVTTGTSVTIPSSVQQTGIIPNYTNYSAFFDDWAWTQRKIADIWAEQGKPESHKVATISGYYLVATSLTFGTTGDIISVVLDDGTYFNAIIADSKGSGDGVVTNEWGHFHSGGKVDIIEWEATGPTNSAYTDQEALRSALQQAGFLGKKVNRIVNYGSWING